jgi:antitoxin ParD1/3/4
MNVHLTPELETLVHNKVKTGRYNSASEVVREALGLFEERERIQELQIRGLQKKINQGWASLERGEGVDGEEFFRGLEREEQELGRTRVSTSLKGSQFHRSGRSHSAEKFAFEHTKASAGRASEIPDTPSSAGPEQISTQTDTLQRRQSERPP